MNDTNKLSSERRKIISIIIVVILVIFLWKIIEPKVYYSSFSKFLDKELSDKQIKDYKIEKSKKCTESSFCMDGSCFGTEVIRNCYSFDVLINIDDKNTLISHIDYVKLKPVYHINYSLKKDLDIINLFKSHLNMDHTLKIVSFHTRSYFGKEFEIKINDNFVDVYRSDFLESLYSITKESNDAVKDVKLYYNDGYSIYYSFTNFNNEEDASIEILNKEHRKVIIRRGKGYLTLEEIQQVFRGELDYNPYRSTPYIYK